MKEKYEKNSWDAIHAEHKMPFYGVNIKWILWMAERIPKDGLLMDVGCGGGYLTDEFRKLGYDVVGVDSGEPQIEIARKFFPDSKFLLGDAREVISELKPRYVTGNGVTPFNIDGNTGKARFGVMVKFVELLHSSNVERFVASNETVWNIDRRNGYVGPSYNWDMAYGDVFAELRKKYKIEYKNWGEAITWSIILRY